MMIKGSMNSDLKEIEHFFRRNKKRDFVKSGLEYFFDSPTESLNKRRVEAMLKMCVDVDGKNILDLCSGTCLLSILLSLRGGNIQAVDFDETSIQTAKKLKKELNGKNVKFVNGDILQLNIPSYSQDFIILAYALHHIPEPTKVLEKARKWLKEDGILIVNEENKSAPLFKIKNFVRFKILRDTKWESHFSYSELKKVLSEQRFELMEEETFDYLPFPNKFKWCIVLKLMKKRGGED